MAEEIQDYRLDTLEKSVTKFGSSLEGMRKEFHEFSDMVKKWLGQSEKEYESRLARMEVELAVMRRVMWGVCGAAGTAIMLHIVNLLEITIP